MTLRWLTEQCCSLGHEALADLIMLCKPHRDIENARRRQSAGHQSWFRRLFG